MIQEETSRENEMNEEINGNIEETILQIQEIDEDEKKEYTGCPTKTGPQSLCIQPEERPFPFA